MMTRRQVFSGRFPRLSQFEEEVHPSMPFSHLSDSATSKPLAVFSDFDGTIAHPDTLNFLADSFAGVEFRQRVGRQIVAGEVSLRDAIQQEVGVIQGSLNEVLSFLRQHVEIDSGFPSFARWCFEREIPITVLSGGMRQVIEALLEPHGLNGLRILANQVRIEGNRWSLDFLDDTPWGHDKGAALLQAKQNGYLTVFLGDGLSDRGAAQQADIVFAKSGLARFCRDQKIPHHEFEDFAEVQKLVGTLR